MEQNKTLKKFVYEDNGIRVIKGYILEEDEFLYKIEADRTGALITLGKRSIVKVDDLGGGSHE